MPSSVIHASSVTYCMPPEPSSKSATITTTSASTTTIAPSTSQRPTGRGRKALASPATSGRNSTTERWMVIGSRAGDEEIEGQAGHPEEQAEGIGAHVAALQRARERAARSHDRGGPSHDRALHEVGLHDAAGEAAAGGRGAHEGAVEEFVEVPLVHEEAVHAAEAPAQLPGQAGACRRGRRARCLRSTAARQRRARPPPPRRWAWCP